MTSKTFGLKTQAVTIRFFETLWKEIKAHADKTGQSDNSAVNALLRERLEELKRPPLGPYSLLQNDRIVAIYDRTRDSIVAVFIEDLDDSTPLRFACDMHAGAETCEHIKFAKSIPAIKRWEHDIKADK